MIRPAFLNSKLKKESKAFTAKTRRRKESQNLKNGFLTRTTGGTRCPGTPHCSYAIKALRFYPAVWFSWRLCVFAVQAFSKLKNGQKLSPQRREDAKNVKT